MRLLTTNRCNPQHSTPLVCNPTAAIRLVPVDPTRRPLRQAAPLCTAAEPRPPLAAPGRCLATARGPRRRQDRRTCDATCSHAQDALGRGFTPPTLQSGTQWNCNRPYRHCDQAAHVGVDKTCKPDLASLRTGFVLCPFHAHILAQCPPTSKVCVNHPYTGHFEKGLWRTRRADWSCPGRGTESPRCRKKTGSPWALPPAAPPRAACCGGRAG